MEDKYDVAVFVVIAVVIALVVIQPWRAPRKPPGPTPPPEKEKPIAQVDWFQYQNGQVTTTIDPIHNYNRHIIARADATGNYNSPGEWSAAGGTSLTKYNGVYYISLRQRTPARRGGEFEIYKSTSPMSSWSLVFEESMSDVSRSVEGSCLRNYNGTWYFYFCVVPQGAGYSDWQIVYTSANTLGGLQADLNDPSSWNRIATGKDPKVLDKNGEYYLLCSWDDRGLWESNSPTFAGKTKIGDPKGVVKNNVNPTNMTGPGIITYDNSSGRYIYTGQFSLKGRSEIYWGWAVSKDLRNWQYAGKKHMFTWVGNYNSTFRFYGYVVEGNDEYFTAEWDHNNDHIGYTWIWNLK